MNEENKVLFPGITQDALNQQIQAQKQQEKQDYIQAITNKYHTDITRNIVSRRQLIRNLVKLNSDAILLSFFITNIIWLGGNATKTQDNRTPYKQGIQTAYWPIKTNPNTQKNTFNPTIAWITNLIIALYTARKNFTTVTDAREKASTANNRQKAVNTMAQIKLYNAQTPTDCFYIYHWQMENLMATAQDIVAKMSQDDRVYFDMLLSDKIHARLDSDQECSNLQQFASIVMMAHLDNHPEDAAKILNTFNNMTIPSQVMAHINKQRSK